MFLGDIISEDIFECSESFSRKSEPLAKMVSINKVGPLSAVFPRSPVFQFFLDHFVFLFFLSF